MEWLNEFHGIFLNENLLYWGIGFTLLALTFGYQGAPLWLWSLLLVAGLVGFGAPEWVLYVFVVIALVFNLPPLRRYLVSSVVMKIMKALKFVPTISETERTALEAGVVWIERDLFSGKPDFKKIINESYPELTKEEQAFLDGPVEELCAMIDEWKVWKERGLPKPVWDFIKKNKFLGMIIPKAYGGLEFSALAHSAVIKKLTTRSLPTAITVMVPNSLGPAELLIHFGTEEQKNHYLPRLATGEDLPCFALTEPGAGSDAGSIQSTGVLFKGGDGKLYIRLNWNKRWITLAAVSTVLGLAFRLLDPDNLLGQNKEEVGITCALVPTHTPGVIVGRRHDPLGVPFYNCPTQGKDVVIPVDSIIGGLPNAGKGWGMLMESLGAGRGVSLPSQSAGGAMIATRVASSHAAIRKQFGLPIGKFEGVEEPLGRMGGLTYAIEAMRKYTLGALDQGVKPPVVTAIVKYHSTELSRIVINDVMDVMGGTAISKGPRNLVANQYTSAPIAITVEGANILTRTLMIFGQGALRAHPFAYKEVSSLEAGNLKGFDEAFWGHMGHVFRNAIRAVVLSVTRGRIYMGSPVGGPVRRHYQKLAWASATFAIMADVAMGSLGGKLKAKEMITGRFADILSWMYIGSAVLRRFEAEGCRKEDLPFVHFAMNWGFHQMQMAFDGIFSNLKVPFMNWLFGGIIHSWSRMNSIGNKVSDELSQKVSKLLLTEGEQRDRITAEGVFIPKKSTEQMARLESAFKIIKQSEEAERKIKKAIKAKILPKKRVAQLIDEALQKNVITSADHASLMASEEARWDVIQVDDFSEEEFRAMGEFYDPRKVVSAK